jgi:hypothetical protein
MGHRLECFQAPFWHNFGGVFSEHKAPGTSYSRKLVVVLFVAAVLMETTVAAACISREHHRLAARIVVEAIAVQVVSVKLQWMVQQTSRPLPRAYRFLVLVGPLQSVGFLLAKLARRKRLAARVRLSCPLLLRRETGG